METSVERTGTNTVVLSVTVPAEDVDSAIDRAYGELAGRVRIPGFRKGKAPKPLIDTHLGREAVLAEALETVVSEAYRAAIDAEGLHPVDNPDVGELDLVEPGKPFSFSAEVVVRPEFKLTSTEDITVKVAPRRSEEREIDLDIEHMRDRFASLEPVDDRGIEDGDFVLLSFTGLIDGEPYEGNVVDKYLYETGRGIMPKEFDEALAGAKPGDEVTASFTVPDTSSNPDFVGKQASFAITVHEVKAKVLPPLDDEFAATVGGFDTLQQLREDIRTKLDSSKEFAYHQRVELGAREELAKRVEDDEVPQAMVKTRRDQMMRDFYNGLESRGMNIQDYVQATGVDISQITADVEEQALASLRQDLALEALFRDLGMEVTESDVNEEIASMVAEGQDVAEVRARWEELELLPAVTEQAKLRIASKWLVEHATVIEESPEDAEAEEAPEQPKKKARGKKKAAEEAAGDTAAQDEQE